MSELKTTTARLAGPIAGRTEADIQSDIKEFLLDAPLALDADEVLEVNLEAQAGGGRRIDVEAGFAAIEVKKSLRPGSSLDRAIAQLARYVRQRTEERGQRYVGVLTDGREWLLCHLRPDGKLAEVSRFRLRGPEDADRLHAWLEPVLATTQRITPTPAQILRRLGAESPAAQLDLASLRSLYADCRNDPEVRVKRELWARLLLSALGTNFEDSDELFVTHTYLVLIAELLAHEVMDIDVTLPDDDVRALLEGQRFRVAGLHGVVEADFFDWPATVSAGEPIIRSIARRLGTFDWSEVEHDVLKALYESVIDAETRHKLGEYYTPDWMAQKMIDEVFVDPLAQRLLDPSCGSGTFLFWAIRRLLAACDAAGLDNRETLQRVVSQVQGIDLHPVAVTLARVTYLLALTPNRLADRGELTVPIYLGDSVRWETDETLTTTAGITIRTSDDLEFFSQELHFPEGVVEEPVRFDRLVAELADRAANRRRGTKPPKISGLLNRHKIEGETDRAAVELAFQKLCRLHDAGRDHVWSYYIRNLARPLAFTRVDNQADILVGNPPWLAYRHMTESLQRTYRSLAEERGLWTGGKVATHQDLSDLFVARAVEQYLRPGGRFAFVMPHAVLSRRQFAGFRTGDWSVRGGSLVLADLQTPEDFARIKPPPFPVASCVISGNKADRANAVPPRANVWSGRVSGRQIAWSVAAKQLTTAKGIIETASDMSGSPYRDQFRQGAVLVPRVLLMVEPSGPTRLGVAADRTAVKSLRSASEKAPWKALDGRDDVVESEFIREVHLGSTMVAFRARTPLRSVIPEIDGELLDGNDDRLDEFRGLADWWRWAESEWEAHKSKSSRLSLRDQIDFQSKLRKQFPLHTHRVVYTKSGQHLAACRIEKSQAVIDHMLYWAPVRSVEEGRYLCVILNSTTVARAVAPLQNRGQHNPRHFDTHVFALPFPLFDAMNASHRELAALGTVAEQVAGSVVFDEQRRFEKAREQVRDALREHGIATQIDRAVGEFLGNNSSKPSTGDLLDVFAAVPPTRSKRRPRRSPPVPQKPRLPDRLPPS